MKTYNLTNDETVNIDSRQSIIKQYQYLIHTINQDIQLYMDAVVLKRLAVKEGDKYKLSPDNKKVEVEDNEEKKDK